MEPITWSIVASLVVKYGIPFTEQLIANIQNNKPVTAEEWNSLTTKINTPFATLVPKVGP
jgi:hypothetical protein